MRRSPVCIRAGPTFESGDARSSMSRLGRLSSGLHTEVEDRRKEVRRGPESRPSD